MSECDRPSTGCAGNSAIGDLYVVHQVRYRCRGWNSPDLPALSNVFQAIRGHPDTPIVLVGHSMGGRVAAHSSERMEVAGIVARSLVARPGRCLITSPRLITIHGTARRLYERTDSPPCGRDGGFDVGPRNHLIFWMLTPGVVTEQLLNALGGAGR